MELDKDQKYVIEQIMKFKKPIQKIGGLAGTGKSFIVKELTKKLPNFVVCTFTGKASSVLRKRGVDASTIHSVIYKPFKVDTPDGLKMYWKLAESVPFDGFLIDEASMISQEIFYDLISFKKPIIFVGDHGQLEPVGKSINLMAKPDFILEKIHRNAGEIAYFGQWLRKGYRPAAFQAKEKVVFINKLDINSCLLEVDQIICAFNKNRVEINNEVRKQMGYKGLLNKNERIICLKNNKMQGLFNGMQGIVQNISKNNKIDFVSDDGFLYENIKFDKHQFGKEKHEIDGDKDAPNPFDYAHALTCHKVQGSEANSILVLEQRCNAWDNRRWFYTAATRAREKIIWAC